MRIEALMSTLLKKKLPTPGATGSPLAGAYMDPNELARVDWVKEARAKVRAPPQGSAAYCAKSTGAESRTTLDFFVVSESVEGKIEKVGVVNVYLPSPHKAVRCTITSQKSGKLSEQNKVPKKLP